MESNRVALSAVENKIYQKKEKEEEEKRDGKRSNDHKMIFWKRRGIFFSRQLRPENNFFSPIFSKLSIFNSMHFFRNFSHPKTRRRYSLFTI